MCDRITTHSPEETEAVGERLAKKLQPGAVIAFTGDLGAGKTALTRGLARGLGVLDRVTSPTYTLVNEYDTGRLPLFHFDLYRLEQAEEVYDIGWEDYLTRGGVCAVEWSEKIAPLLPEDVIRVELRRSGGEETREIAISGVLLAEEEESG